jgi:hypothetical protein
VPDRSYRAQKRVGQRYTIGPDLVRRALTTKDPARAATKEPRDRHARQQRPEQAQQPPQQEANHLAI